MDKNFDHLNNVNRHAAPDDLSWQDDALCSQTDPEIFFPEKNGSSANAKKVCGQCDVGLKCLMHALKNNERDSVYGGLNAIERRKLLKASREEVERAYAAAQVRNKRR